MAGKFRIPSTWDPILIIFQILTVQSFNYASLVLVVTIATIMSGQMPSTRLIFNHTTLRLGNAKLVIISHIANSVIGAHLLKKFVERSKSCLDFSVTYFIIHFLIVWYRTGTMPDTFVWYFVNMMSAFIMCVMGEFLCRREEMKSIPISSADSNHN